MSESYGLKINQQIQLEQLMKQIKQTYQQLKKCQYTPVKMTIIGSLKPKCLQAIKILQKNQMVSPNVKKKNQLIQIKNKIEEVQANIQKEQRKNSQIGNGGRFNQINKKLSYSQQDLKAQFGQQATQEVNSYKNLPIKLVRVESQQNSNQGYRPHKNIEERRELNPDSRIYQSSIKVMRSIAQHELKSVHLKYTKQELDQVLKRMQDNQEVMKTIQQMLIEQGNNLDKVQQNIQKAYTFIGNSNQQLKQAEKLQVKRIGFLSNAFRKTGSGIWGFISWPFRKFYSLFKKKS